MSSYKGYARIGSYDAQGNFISGSVNAVLQGGSNTIYVEPTSFSPANRGTAPTPDLDEPFGATIYGYTAGDALMVRQEYRDGAACRGIKLLRP